MPKPTLLDVAGKAFSRARESFANTQETNLVGEYGSGTQDWLAEEAGISKRTIQSLEDGKASS